jgi:hypothetical protein
MNMILCTVLNLRIAFPPLLRGREEMQRMEERSWRIANGHGFPWFACALGLLVALASRASYSYNKVQNQVPLLCISKLVICADSILGLADHVTRVRNNVSLFPNMEANNERHCMYYFYLYQNES